MRRGNQGKTVIRLEDEKTLLGVNLGADFTAEHEWGIEKLRRIYGIDNQLDGIKGRLISQAPADRILRGEVRFGKPKATWHALVSFASPYHKEHNTTLDKELIDRLELTPYGDDEIHGAWDESSFGILTKDELVIGELSEAIDRLDLCIAILGALKGNPFSRPGLCLLIASRIPKVVAAHWLESDLDQKRLITASEATGIADRLQKAGRRYYALSPKWADAVLVSKRGESKTNHPVVYWLNPMDQDSNNYGWFTVEELDKWVKGKGPVPKKRAA